MADFFECFVLRCAKPGTEVFVTGEPHRRIDYAVCVEHDAYLKRGGDWRLQTTSPDPSNFVLELLCDPDDLNGDGALVVEGFATLRGSELSSRGDRASYLELQTRRWGQSDLEELRLHLTRDQLVGLRDLLISAFGDRA